MISDSSQLIYLNSDTEIELFNLHDEYSNSPINNASVTAVLSDAGENLFTFALAYIPGSQGDYQGTIPITVGATLIENNEYILDVAGTDGTTFWGERLKFIAGYKGAE